MMYIILSILCSTIIFILFKLFGKYDVNNLQAIVGNYFIAGVLGWLPYIQTSNAPNIIEWSIWPLLIGFMFITLFQLMAKITQERGVNVVSVTVKMSVMIPILSGILIYNETITNWNAIGIALALLAVYAINKPRPGTVRTTGSAWIGPAILFIGSGLLDAFLKVIKEDFVAPDNLGAFTSTAFAIAGVLGVLFVIFRIYIKRDLNWSPKSWIWGLALGIPNYGSIYFLLKALDGKIPSAVLFPINNVGIVGLSAVVAWALFKERITTWKLLGLIFAGIAIVLMSLS